mmetsp:Transcript_20731/g.49380  ORF Transcript_20731/g.49380 Transcript_20731/m.49380 type:complete len:255 (+) Transcript_20731:333-1097(+)
MLRRCASNPVQSCSLAAVAFACLSQLPCFPGFTAPGEPGTQVTALVSLLDADLGPHDNLEKGLQNLKPHVRPLQLTPERVALTPAEQVVISAPDLVGRALSRLHSSCRDPLLAVAGLILLNALRVFRPGPNCELVQPEEDVLHGERLVAGAQLHPKCLHTAAGLLEVAAPLSLAHALQQVPIPEPCDHSRGVQVLHGEADDLEAEVPHLRLPGVIIEQLADALGPLTELLELLRLQTVLRCTAVQALCDPLLEP